jgi:hypothetical protein
MPFDKSYLCGCIIYMYSIMPYNKTGNVLYNQSDDRYSYNTYHICERKWSTSHTPSQIRKIFFNLIAMFVDRKEDHCILQGHMQKTVWYKYQVLGIGWMVTVKSGNFVTFFAENFFFHLISWRYPIFFYGSKFIKKWFRWSVLPLANI